MAVILTHAAHGGYDPGAKNPYTLGYDEKVINLKIDEAFYRLATANGHRVYRTRTKDVFVGVGVIPETARRVGAQVVIEINVNSAPQVPTSPGVEVWALRDTPSARLAALMAEQIARHAGMNNRGVRYVYPGWQGYGSRWDELRRMGVLHVLTENGFINHPGDEAKLRDPNVIQAIAYGHLAGIHRYFNLPDPSRQQPPVVRKLVPWLIVIPAAAIGGVIVWRLARR